MASSQSSYPIHFPNRPQIIEGGSQAKADAKADYPLLPASLAVKLIFPDSSPSAPLSVLRQPATLITTTKTKYHQSVKENLNECNRNSKFRRLLGLQALLYFFTTLHFRRGNPLTPQRRLCEHAPNALRLLPPGNSRNDRSSNRGNSQNTRPRIHCALEPPSLVSRAAGGVLRVFIERGPGFCSKYCGDGRFGEWKYSVELFDAI